MPDIVTFAKGMTAGMAICGAVTTPEIAEKSKGHAGLPWSGTYPHDPLPAAVALKQLQIVLRDKLVERAAALGKHMRPLLDKLKDDFEPIGDVRGMALYQMLDIVTDRKSRKPDFAMAERIRYYAALEGVHHHLREELHPHLPAAHHHRGADRRHGGAATQGHRAGAVGFRPEGRAQAVELARGRSSRRPGRRNRGDGPGPNFQMIPLSRYGALASTLPYPIRERSIVS
jgi:hypothetical protein